MSLVIENQDAFAKFFVGALARAMKDEADQLPDLMTALVLENMHEGRNPDPNTRNTTSMVYERSGGLKRGFIPGQAGSLSKVTVTPQGVDFTVGTTSIVALVQEYGATITITEKMRKFFWAKYAETGADMWRGLALTKKSVITIPPRPFFSKALQELEAVEVPEIVEAIYQRLARYIS
jgi:hypothetical protein